MEDQSADWTMLDSFKSRLQSSALRAASAAKNFQGLDAMAAKDTYIHSDEEQQPLRHDTDSDDDDPVLQRLQQETAKPGRVVKQSAMHFLEIETESPKNEGRRVHKFMADLDDRLSKPVLPSVTAAHQPPPPDLSSPITLSWWDRLRGSKAVTLVTATPPLARPKPPKKGETKTHDVVNSDAMLSAEDLLQLEAMKILQEPPPRCSVEHTIRHHPREVFVGLTLVVALLVYYYKGSAEDDVK